MAQSLTRLNLQVILIVVACFLAIGYSGYLAMRDMQLSTYRDRASGLAMDVASQINGLLEQQRQQLEKFAQQPGMAALLQRGSAAERSVKESEIRPQLPGALTVHLLAGTGNGTVAGPLEPARLDYVRRMASSGSTAVPEFPMAEKPAEYYNLAVPVMDDNRHAAGYLLAGFSGAPIQATLENSSAHNAYLSLEQPVAGGSRQSVLAAGDTAKAANESVTIEIGHGGWVLAYHAAEAPPPVLAGNSIYYLAGAVAAFGVMMVILFRHYQRTVRAVRHDIHSLIRMFKDLREGSVRVSYPMALREFSEAFEYLRDRGQRMFKEKEKLKGMGLMDHLSQLGNRRHFEVRLKELFEASRANGPSSVLMIDMDHFKAVNDKHGHDAGDALIVGFANALRKVVRQTDVLVRLGGDEFCIIYSYAPLKKAAELVERLRRQLPREIPLTKGVMHQLRWTGGLSAMSDKDARPDDVLWRADQALLQAKETGRNITKIYDPVAGLPAKKQIMAS